MWAPNVKGGEEGVLKTAEVRGAVPRTLVAFGAVLRTAKAWGGVLRMMEQGGSPSSCGQPSKGEREVGHGCNRGGRAVDAAKARGAASRAAKVVEAI